MNKNKIIRDYQYFDFIMENQDDNDYNSSVEIDISDKDKKLNIDKEMLLYTEDLCNSKYDIELIDEYKKRIKEQERIVKIEQKKKEEESKKIENPIDLTEVDVNMYMPIPERRVNFDRTFGISSTRKRALKRRFQIFFWTVFALSTIFILIIYYRLR